MKTNSKIGRITKAIVSGLAPQDPRIPNAGNLEPLYAKKNYESMYAEIEKIKDPVSFEALKDFYGIL